MKAGRKVNNSRHLAIWSFALLLAVSGSCTSVPTSGSGDVSSLNGKWTVMVTRNIDSNAKTCGCSVCRKLEAQGLPPINLSYATIVIDAGRITSASNPDGDSLPVPDHQIALKNTDLVWTLNSEFNALPAGTYVLSGAGDGFVMTVDSDRTATDGRAVNVYLNPN
ncbi:MAG TPA: hypothetical protein VMV81_10000 [Phycisphaerae bacterium]|nr:hypothetical protein [Phycisphaerae bacterium]